MEPCTPGREFLKTERLGRLSAHGGSIDRLIQVYVWSRIGQIEQQGVSSLRQRDRAVVGTGLRAAVDGAIAADWWNGGQRKSYDRLDGTDKPDGHPVEFYRHRQLVELFGRAGQPGSIQ